MLADGPNEHGARSEGADSCEQARAEVDTPMDTEGSPDIQVEADRNLSNSRVAAAAPEGLSEDVMAAEFPERAITMFLNGDGAPHSSGKPPTIDNTDDIAFGHLKSAKVTVGDHPQRRLKSGPALW